MKLGFIAEPTEKTDPVSEKVFEEVPHSSDVLQAENLVSSANARQAENLVTEGTSPVEELDCPQITTQEVQVEIEPTVSPELIAEGNISKKILIIQYRILLSLNYGFYVTY